MAARAKFRTVSGTLDSRPSATYSFQVWKLTPSNFLNSAERRSGGGQVFRRIQGGAEPPERPAEGVIEEWSPLEKGVELLEKGRGGSRSGERSLVSFHYRRHVTALKAPLPCSEAPRGLVKCTAVDSSSCDGFPADDSSSWMDQLPLRLRTEIRRVVEAGMFGAPRNSAGFQRRLT